MTERVFWCNSMAVGELTLDEAESRHARTSLRLEPGDRVTLLDGAGRIGHAFVLGSGDRKRASPVRVKIERIEAVEPPARRLTLLVAACKGERMDWLIEKCTELGLDRVWITAFERSVANPGDGKLDRYQRLARQACKQCNRVWMPELRAELSLLGAMTCWRECVRDGLLFVAHPDRTAMTFGAALRSCVGDAGDFGVVVGPEGGLSDAELAQLRECGAQPVRLAAHVLRVETAAVAVAGSWADWRSGAATKRL